MREVGSLLRAADPGRDLTVPAPPMSAAELMAYADATAHAPTVRPAARPTRRWLLVGASASVAAAVGAYAFVVGVPGPPAQPEQTPPPHLVVAGPVLQPIAYEISGDAPPAGEYLRALAANLADAPYEHSEGGYTYHRTRHYGGTVLYSPEGHAAAMTEELQVWEGADGTGLQRRTQLGMEFRDQASREYWMAKHPDGVLVDGPRDTRLEKAIAVPRPPMPTDHAGLVEFLLVEDGIHVGTLIKRMYSWYVVPTATRAAILDLLADIPGWSWRGGVTDRAGRSGVAVTFHDTVTFLDGASLQDVDVEVEELLIFDAVTGVLLAHELVQLTPKQVSSYTLILDTDRRARMG